MNRTNNSILIFTDKYPYGSGEMFFQDELEFIVRSFDKILIFPIETGNSTIVRNLYGSVELVPPVFTSLKNKRELLLKGILNTSPIYPFFRELIKKSIYGSHFSLYNWFVHFLMVRSALQCIRKKHWIQQFNKY